MNKIIPIVDEQHAKLSPSASDRWLECGVAPSREATMPDKSSAAAAWGTAAHAMAAHCLTHGIDSTHLGPNADWEKYDGLDMRNCVQEYIEHVRRVAGDTHIFVEQKLQIFPEFGVWGTADAVVVGHEPGLIDVIDLKGGVGVLVDADSSSQLKLYGWGGYQSLEWLSEIEVDRIRVTIVQPRRGHVVSKIFTVEELTAWVAEAMPKVKLAYDADGKATPGDHCLWCRVKAVCPERAAYIQESAALDFEFAGDEAAVNPSLMPMSWLVSVFKNIPLIRQYLKDIETYVADVAHSSGVAPEGLKWVGGRATRYVNDEEPAAAALRRLGIMPYEEPSMLGITALEKALKAKGLKVNDVLGPFLSKKVSPPVLVDVSDKRESYNPNAGAAEDFG